MWLLCMFSGEAGSSSLFSQQGGSSLFSQQGALYQGTGMTGMATAADDEELLVSLCRMTLSQFIRKE